MWNCLQSQLHKATPAYNWQLFPSLQQKQNNLCRMCGRNSTGCCWLPCSLLFDFRTRLLYWFLAQVHNPPTHTHTHTHSQRRRHRNTPCGWCSSDGMCISVCICIPWLPKWTACVRIRYCSNCFIHNGVLAKLTCTHIHLYTCTTTTEPKWPCVHLCECAL